MPKYRILSLDGGGIKGLFTISLLERVTRAYPKLLERTDLFAGTSTGGILALGLAAGRSPSELAALYRDNGPKIFDDSLLDDLVDLGHAVGAQYDHRGLKAALRREFGDLRLRDLDKRVVVPSFHLDAPATRRRPRAWKPKFFHNFPGRDSDGAETVVDVALRTSSAPTYFPSYQGFIDGGVVANNPAMAAVAQALDPRAAARRLRDLRVLSVSTGTEPKFIRGKRVDWGWGQWARPLVSVMISGVMGVADYQCRQLLADRYYRLDHAFRRGIDLDDVRPGSLARLERAAVSVRLGSVLNWLKRQRW